MLNQFSACGDKEYVERKENLRRAPTASTEENDVISCSQVLDGVGLLGCISLGSTLWYAINFLEC